MSADRPLHFGVVGTGLIASVTTRAIAAADGAEVVAVSARQQATADAFAANHGVAVALDDWTALIARDDIDAVYVATPTAPREAICLAAARAGKHVLGDKPFLSAASVSTIAAACRAAGVVFMDATHFTHHPRSALLRRELGERVGPVQGLRASFFFPNTDRGSIRFDRALEPTGAIGDMAWYCLRALVEYAADAPLLSANGFLHVDGGVAVRGAGVLALEGGTTLTWDAGYSSGACAQDLHLLGERGEVWLDDFVLDWPQSFPAASPGRVAGFHQRSGVAGPDGFGWTEVANDKPQVVRMIEHFASMAREPGGAEAAAAMRRSERTQSLLDAAWGSLVTVSAR